MAAGAVRALARRLALLAGALLVVACSSTDKPKPTPLEPPGQPPAGVAWSAKLSGVRFPLAVTPTGTAFVVADSDGGVTALAIDDGRPLWRGDAGAPLTAGVGSDGRYAAVVTRDNDLVVLDEGRVAWKSRLGARVTTAPLVAGERVFVVGVDRLVQGFDVLDGRLLWRLQRPGDALTLSQHNVLRPYKDTLLVGQGPRLAGVDPLRGSVRWEVALATPRGTNEVERLADLVGPAVRDGGKVCARAFQSAVGCVDAEQGKLIWSKNIGGTEGVGGDGDLLVGADGSGRITAWKAAGETAWTSERLLHRGLSAPAAFGTSIVFGDFEGMVHFLARGNGDLVGRVPTDGSPVVAAPVVSGSTLVVVTRSGGVFALRAR